MWVCLGKTDQETAVEFVAQHADCKLGSLSADGFRRVNCSATGEARALRFAEFSLIAQDFVAEPVVPRKTAPPACDHRGSQRKTCCGSPDVWICRELKQDCVGTQADAVKLRTMVATEEAAAIKVCETCPHRKSGETEARNIEVSTETIAVVIPCHNYARFLAECVESVLHQTVVPQQIIVVDDSSTDDPKSVCDRFPEVRYERCEVRDVHKARQHGMQFVECTYVCFLDADDTIPPRYFENARDLFRQDRNVAITYPQLEYFGDATGPAHGTERAPQQLRGDDIEQRNWVSAGAVLRSELVRQSLAFRREIDPKKSWTQDWHVAKAILRSGNWTASKMQEVLHYRKHGDNMSARPNRDYWADADFDNESITIVIAFSGRWECWSRLHAWLLGQTWPIRQVRLLIMNATHEPLTAGMLGLQEWRGDLQIERIDAGYPRLADQDRRGIVRIGRDVEAAVGAIYNRAVTLLGTEYVVFIEDDVVPLDANLVEKMFRTMGPWVSGVSGVYRQRYQADKCCAFDVPYVGNESFKSLHGAGIEKVGGTGFGCLMTRRSLLRRFPLSGDGPDRYFDVAFGAACGRADGGWWHWLLNRDIQADHLLCGDLRPVDLLAASTPPMPARQPKVVAFDFGGTLRLTDGISGLRELAGTLNRAGVPCVVISAIEEGAPTHYAENEIKAFRDSNGIPLSFQAVRFVRYKSPADERELYRVGVLKAEVMKELGAQILFDDLEPVCRAVTESGLQAVRVAAQTAR